MYYGHGSMHYALENACTTVQAHTHNSELQTEVSLESSAIRSVRTGGCDDN